MSNIENLTQFVPGTKALASEVNGNFETLRVSNNDNDSRINELEAGVDNKFDKSGGDLSGAIRLPEAKNISSENGIVTLDNTSNSFAVAGQETITQINGWDKGIAIIRWTTSRILKNSPNLILQDASSRTTNDGDVGIYEFSGNIAREISYFSFYSNKSNSFKSATVLNCPKNSQGVADFIKKTELSPDVIPLMSSNTHDECVISASSQADATQVPWRACDNSNINTTCWHTLAGMPTGWLKLDFTNPKQVCSLAITSRNHTDANTISPKEFIIEGSDDDINYNLLGYWNNITGWVQNEKRVFAFQNTTPFKYYKLSILANNGATYTGLGEFELFEAINDIPSLNTRIECSAENPILLNFPKGFNLNGKINEIASIAQNQVLDDLFDNSITYIAAEKDTNGEINILKTTAPPAYAYSRQKNSEINAIPKMISNTTSQEFTSGYQTTASSFYNATYAPYCAFDKLPLSKWMSSVVGGNQFVQIDFPNKRKAARFAIKAGDTPNQTVKNGIIKGWDGTDWINLVEISEQTDWIGYETRYFEATAFEECSKFKLEILDINNMAGHAAISEFEIYELGYCYVIPENKFYLYNPETSLYEEKQIVFLGKIFSSNGFVTDARTFAQNGKYRSAETDLSINSIYNFYHNVGCDYKNLKISGWIKDKINGAIMPWSVDSNFDYTYDGNNYGFMQDDCIFTVKTLPTLMRYKDVLNTNKSANSNVSIILEIERSFG